jgi:hypothetical protein
MADNDRDDPSPQSSGADMDVLGMIVMGAFTLGAILFAEFSD